MALIHDSLGDFVLFPRDQVFPDLIAPPPTDNFGGFYHSSLGMDHRSQFVAPTRTTYDSYPVTTTHSTAAAYYETSRTHLNSIKAGDEGSMPRPTPSASPSSMSQTFDPSSSVLSSTSGASAQSAASSVGGSPYARPTQQMPFQDKWSEPLQGLGISSGVASGDFLGYDTSRQDFVGEYKENILSSLPSTGASASSISLAPASQELSSLYYVPRSKLLANSHKEEMAIDAILREVGCTNTDQAPLMSPASSTSTTGPPTAFSGKDYDPEPPTDYRTVSPPLRNIASTTPQQLPMSPPQSGPPSVGMNTSHGSLILPSASPTSFRNHQDPFFSQSSGRFVAPLHSSCWFSFASAFLLLRGFFFLPFLTSDCKIN